MNIIDRPRRLEYDWIPHIDKDIDKNQYVYIILWEDFHVK
jgi:hypothetical protein